MADAQEMVHDPYAEMLKSRLERRSAADLLPQVKRAIGVLIDVAKLRFFVLLGAQVVTAGGVAVQVLLTKMALDALLRDQGLGHVLPLVLTIVFVNSAVGALGALQGQYQALLSEMVIRNTWQRVLAVATSVPLLTFERSDYYDRLQRIRANALVKPLQIAQGAIGFISGSLSVVGLLVALLALQPVVVPVILLAGLPMYVLARIGGRLEYEFALRTTRNQRERYALIDLLTDRQAAKEVRAFALHSWLTARFLDRYETYVAALREKVNRKLRIALFSALVTAVVAGVAATLLIVLIDRGQVSLSEAGASVAAVVLLASRIQQLFAGVSSILEAGLFVRDIDDFETLAGPLRAANPQPGRGFDKLELQSVSFSYPGREGAVLRDITTTIRRGEVVAVVGPNGSGKTTLSKVLANLYAPSEGVVLWDGEDVLCLDQDVVARSVTVLFQDFVRYELTFHENIAVGDVTDMDDRMKVEDAAAASGADSVVSSLPGSYETFMSTRFPEGMDLSTGQWQRVAMARALFRDAPFVILDEPTAALDARAEEQLYQLMQRVLHGRTVVLVTHRLASARQADRVIVMDHGSIAEEGTHSELMARKGYYAEMFQLQAAALGMGASASGGTQ